MRVWVELFRASVEVMARHMVDHPCFAVPQGPSHPDLEHPLIEPVITLTECKMAGVVHGGEPPSHLNKPRKKAAHHRLHQGEANEEREGKEHEVEQDLEANLGELYPVGLDMICHGLVFRIVFAASRKVCPNSAGQCAVEPILVKRVQFFGDHVAVLFEHVIGNTVGLDSFQDPIAICKSVVGLKGGCSVREPCRQLQDIRATRVAIVKGTQVICFPVDIVIQCICLRKLPIWRESVNFC
mmetsp:Transcript_19565/g.36153  ORF Transcript_19565/g.36153 Transcript_19565/m.36153 type:complete len:240 (+) Transcript_19565:940-1659(+)